MVSLMMLQSKYERARRTCRCGVVGAVQAGQPCAVHTVAAAHANSYFNISPSGDQLDDYAWYVVVCRHFRRCLAWTAEFWFYVVCMLCRFAVSFASPSNSVLSEQARALQKIALRRFQNNPCTFVFGVNNF